MVTLYDLQNNVIATGSSIVAIVLANKSKLAYANLCNQDLSSQNLSGCNFWGAALDYVNLTGSNCSGCDFSFSTQKGLIYDPTTSFYLARNPPGTTLQNSFPIEIGGD